MSRVKWMRQLFEETRNNDLCGLFLRVFVIEIEIDRAETRIMRWFEKMIDDDGPKSVRLIKKNCTSGTTSQRQLNEGSAR
jgi:hypothetical protein